MAFLRLPPMRLQRASERYQFLLNNDPELIRRVPQKYLASWEMQTIFINQFKEGIHLLEDAIDKIDIGTIKTYVTNLNRPP